MVHGPTGKSVSNLGSSEILSLNHDSDPVFHDHTSSITVFVIGGGFPSSHGFNDLLDNASQQPMLKSERGQWCRDDYSNHPSMWAGFVNRALVRSWAFREDSSPKVATGAGRSSIDPGGEGYALEFGNQNWKGFGISGYEDGSHPIASVSDNFAKRLEHFSFSADSGNIGGYPTKDADGLGNFVAMYAYLDKVRPKAEYRFVSTDFAIERQKDFRHNPTWSQIRQVVPPPSSGDRSKPFKIPESRFQAVLWRGVSQVFLKIL